MSKQNSRLHALISKVGIDKETKAEMVFKYTNGKHTSSADMTFSQREQMINDLQRIANQMPMSVAEQSANQQRRKLFALCHEIGWELPNGKVDEDRLEKWILKYGHQNTKGKRLKDYTGKELPKLVTQFELVEKHKIHASK